jgi:protein-S-isoprenylcysteine O-methyltransferase Ste14
MAVNSSTRTVPAAAVAAVAATASGAAPRRAHRSLADPEYRAGVRYLVFGRAFPAILFGIMGWIQVQRLGETLPAPSLSAAFNSTVPRGIYLLFCTIPVAIYLTRPRPLASDGRLAARAAAFGGTLMQLVVGAFAPDSMQLFTTPAWYGTVSTLLVIVAWSFAVWGLAYLRRSLSIIPEARRLATKGPYRLVRHPLYCAEITAAVAVTTTGMKLLPLASLGVFVILQLCRTAFEEHLLRDTFPEYAAYAARTRRLIPFVL